MSSSRAWSSDDDAILDRRWKAGDDVSVIAGVLGRSPGSINSRAYRKFGKSARANRPRALSKVFWTADRIQLLRKEWVAGRSAMKIAAIFHLSDTAIRRAARKYLGADFHREKPVNEVFKKPSPGAPLPVRDTEHAAWMKMARARDKDERELLTRQWRNIAEQQGIYNEDRH